MEPSDTRTFRLADGRSVTVIDLGAPDGRPVVAVHDRSVPAAATFRALGSMAAAIGVRLLVPNRPGYGGSTAMPAQPVLAWPFDIEQVMDEFAVDLFAVFAIGDGCPLATALGFDLPHRVEVVGLLSPRACDAGGGVDLATLTVPVVTWREADGATLGRFDLLLADLLHVADRGVGRR